MKNRIVSILLAVCMLLSVVYTNSVISADASAVYNVRITSNGKEVDELTVTQSEKQELAAHCDAAADGDSYRWQICADVKNDLWVDIYDATAQTLNVSYALVASVIDGSGSAYIRCRLSSNGLSFYSEPVCVTVAFTVSSAVLSATAQTEPSARLSASTSARLRMAPAAIAEQPEYVMLKINYLDYETGSEIYSPYTATLQYGTAFSQNVISPTFLGYAPYLVQNYKLDGEVSTPATSYQFTFAEGELTEDITVNIYYKAVEVPFSISYFFQNVNNDLYTEMTDRHYVGKAETGTIIEDSTIEEHAGDTTGFSNLYHYPESVAADGSTVFHCYYDRNYYMLKFDMKGGYGVDPIYARYGTPFIVNDPVKHGYVFKGWDLYTVDTNNNGEPDMGDGIPDSLDMTIAAGNKSYGAIWETVETTVAYVYWKENANDNGYSYWGTHFGEAMSATYIGADSAPEPTELKDEYLDSPTPKFQDAEHFTERNKPRCDYDVLVNGDGSTVVNVYYFRNRYELLFYGGDDEVCEVEEHTHSREQGCYELTCGKEDHTHTDECLTCSKTEHIHTAECCSLKEHTHSAENGCEEQYMHTHTALCFGATDENDVTPPEEIDYFKGFTDDGTIADGFVYRYQSSSWIESDKDNMYLLYGGKWYSVDTVPSKLDKSDESRDFLRNVTYSRYEPDLNCTNTPNTSYYTCEKPAHTHNTGSCNGANCEFGYEHKHSKQEHCYNCDFDVEHIHTNDCWHLTCPKAQHTHGGEINDTIYIHNAKYDSDISQIWKTGKVYEYLQNYYVFESDATGDYYSFLEKMPDQDIKMKATSWADKQYVFTWHYYLELYEGQDKSGLTVKEANGKSYYLYHTTTTKGSSSLNLTYEEDYFPITGYVQRDSSVPSFSNRTAYLYYNLDESKRISFNNHGLQDGSYYPAYMSDISDLDHTPEYPTNLEPNAYYFDGWYTTAECYPGTEFNFDGARMGSDDIILYAKYSPTQHSVKFFSNRARKLEYQENGNPDLIFAEFTVDHGKPIGQVITPADPSGNNYSFGGWFLIDDSNRLQAFAAFSMPVTHDMLVFADWGSKIAQPYAIHYALEVKESDSDWLALLTAASNSAPENQHTYTATNGSETRQYVYIADTDSYHRLIADSTNGYAYEGSTRTFNAKAGSPYDQLYSGYNSDHFPTVASHSITIESEIAGTAHPDNNVFTFFYVKPKLPLKVTVKYYDRQTNTQLEVDGNPVEDDTYTTTDSVVTQRFKPISGYVPDAFYKRLILTVMKDQNGEWVGDDQENVIIFYYSANKDNAYYAVHHMLQKIDGDENDLENGYEEDDTIIEGIAKINETIAYKAVVFDGFTMKSQGRTSVGGGEKEAIDSTDGSFNIKITAEGTDLYIYYTRNRYDVSVQYLKYNDGNLVDPEKYPVITLQNLQFGSVATYSVYNNERDHRIISGYSLVDTQNLTKSVIVRSKTETNVITFYYTELQYTVEYKVIGGEGGTVDPGIEVKNSSDIFGGAEARAAAGYRFVGWYLDEAATIPADSNATVNGTMLTPNAEELVPVPATNIYYAKFELLTADLTIKRDNVNDQGNGSQVFVYKITDTTDTKKVYYATITSGGSVTIKNLPCVEYTVEQLNGWSWRYGDAAQSVKLTADSTLTFSKNAVKDKWLNGNSSVTVNKK